MTGILFDLDGTLLDTLEDLKDAVNYALTAHGYPTRTLEEVRRFVGNGAARLMALSVPEGAAYEPVLETYKVYYQSHSQVKTAPYPGVLEALAKIREKYPIAIVSNKPDSAVKLLCRQYFPGLYARGESADCPRKPAPDMVFKAMKAIGVDKCIYVGDSEVDIRTANNAGVPCVSVLWGFRDEPVLRQAGGQYFCRCAEQLLPTIQQIINEEHYGQ